jgi:predicted dehydrogenase
VQALNAGKHVLSEVTAASNIEQCYQLLEAVRTSGRKYMLAENYCWIRPWTVVMGMVRAGLLGEIYYGEAEQLQECKEWMDALRAGDTWRYHELLMRKGHQYISHNLGPLYYAVGERVKTVVCLGTGQRHLPWATADSSCTVLLETTGGKLMRIRLDFFSDRPHNYTYYAVQGTGGAYEGPRAAGERHRVFIKGRTEPGTWDDLWDYAEYLPDGWKRQPAEATNNDFDGGTPLMIEQFARCIIEDTRPPVDVVDALNMTAPGVLSEVSRERGGVPVDVPEFVL